MRGDLLGNMHTRVTRVTRVASRAVVRAGRSHGAHAPCRLVQVADSDPGVHANLLPPNQIANVIPGGSMGPSRSREREVLGVVH